jgi:hypothetical protein
MLSSGSQVRTHALVELDKIQELKQIARFNAHSEVYELRLEKPSEIQEEMEHAPVRNGSSIEG